MPDTWSAELIPLLSTNESSRARLRRFVLRCSKARITNVNRLPRSSDRAPSDVVSARGGGQVGECAVLTCNDCDLHFQCGR